MRISYCYHGQLGVFDRATPEISIGRRTAGATGGPDLDLSPDFTVSRSHARLWRDGEGNYWLEDLGSTHGTQVNGEEIRGAAPRQVQSNDRIQIGETTLQIEGATTPSGIHRATQAPRSAALAGGFAGGLAGEPAGEVAAELPATETEGNKLLQDTPADIMRRMTLLFELMLQCGTATQIDDALQQMVERLVEMIPDAQRGALLLRGRESDTLLLKAFSAARGPVVSETLARRAMQNGSGFIWKRAADNNGGSIARFNIESAMFAPLMWQGTALGVLCVDNPLDTSAFTADDLRLLMTAAHFLALALANQQLQEELRRESAVKAKLLRQFSPQIAEQLLTHGTVQLSGERSEVTILASDIRGFTTLTKDMKPIDVVEMLNDYFNRLTPIIFAHNGTVDKYIGDAILAVFGSPKADPNQHINALKAALDMQAEMVKSNRARAGKGKAICQIGIGVHCGEVLHGNIGAVDQVSYTVIGDAVNRATRFCDGAVGGEVLHGNIGAVDQVSYTVIGDAVNRATRFCDGAVGGEVLLSPQVYQWVWKQVEVEPASLETKHEGMIPAFRLLGIKPS